MIISNKEVCCYEFDTMYQAEKLTFDNAIQRGYVWDIERKSLLIHSIFAGFPIPPIYVQQNQEDEETITYDVLDGKQRLLTIIGFMNDEFALDELDTFKFFNKITKTEEMIDISNKQFSELPKELQKHLENSSLMMVMINGSEDDVSEMFYRLNNGKPLSAIEHSRVKAKDLNTIQEIGNHEIFTNALTEKALAKYTNEEIVVKSYITAFEQDNPDLSSKQVKEKLSTITISEEQKEDLLWCYDYILKAYKLISEDDTDIKLNKKIAKRIITRTHMLSLIPLCIDCKNNNTDIKDFVEFIQTFYCGRKKATLNDLYNSNASAGSSKATNVKHRIEALRTDFKKYFEEE